MLMRTESRPRFAEDGVHPERRERTELGTKQRDSQSRRMSDEAEADSVDSPICACGSQCSCGSPMLMRTESRPRFAEDGVDLKDPGEH